MLSCTATVTANPARMPATSAPRSELVFLRCANPVCNSKRVAPRIPISSRESSASSSPKRVSKVEGGPVSLIGARPVPEQRPQGATSPDSALRLPVPPQILHLIVMAPFKLPIANTPVSAVHNKYTTAVPAPAWQLSATSCAIRPTFHHPRPDSSANTQKCEFASLSLRSPGDRLLRCGQCGSRTVYRGRRGPSKKA